MGRVRAPCERAKVVAVCRIAGYLGHAVSLETMLTRPTRSLSDQARCPRELPPGMIGSDGFGFGWFAGDGDPPARYRSTLPIWVDENVGSMTPHVRSSCFVASSRTASDRMPVAITNTPPFVAGRALLVHNGAIESFHEEVIEILRAKLEAATRAKIVGNTDSEYLAALLADQRGGDLGACVRGMLDIVRSAAREAGVGAQLNVVVVDGVELVAVRHAIDAKVPSLWARAHDGSFVVASEAMEDGDGWREVAAGTMVSVRRGGAPVETRLEG